MSRRPWIVLLLCVALQAIPAAASAEVIDRIVAKINRDIVTLQELRRASGPYLLSFGIDPAELGEREDADKLYQQVLDDLINTRLLLQEANALQIKVSDEDVNEWISRNTLRQQQISEDQLRGALQEKNIRWQDYRRYIQDNLLKLRVIQIRVGSKVKVSDDEVLDAYQQEYGQAPGAGIKVCDISHIFIPLPEGADEVKTAEVEALAQKTWKRVTLGGDEFSAVAKEVSAGPTAADGGHLGVYKPGELDEALDKVVFQAKVGDITEPVRVPSGFHILRIHDARVERDPEVEDQMDDLREKLREAELNKQLTQWLDELRQKSYVKVLY